MLIIEYDNGVNIGGTVGCINTKKHNQRYSTIMFAARINFDVDTVYPLDAKNQILLLYQKK